MLDGTGGQAMSAHNAAPPVITFNPGGVPDYLRSLDRWMLWRNEPVFDQNGTIVRYTKPPLSWHTSQKCDVTDPRNWTSFLNVTTALTKSTAWDGVGISLGPIEQTDEVLFGADLDECLDANGTIEPWAMDLLVLMNTYTDRSPGGHGLKPIARMLAADLPPFRHMLGLADTKYLRTRVCGTKTDGQQHIPGAQLFLDARYFTITGGPWHGTPTDVALLDLSQLSRIAHWFGPRPVPPKDDDDAPQNDDETEPDDATLDARLGGAFLRHPRLHERWEGGTDGLNDTSPSGRDMSIVAVLKADGFTKGETRAALNRFKHGKLQRLSGKRADDYFNTTWNNARPPSPPPPPVIGWVSPTEDAVALAFAAQNQGRIVYDHTEECWFRWTGAQWLRDLRASIFNDARELTRAVRDKLNKVPAPITKIAFVAAIERACRSDPRLAVDYSVWNQDINLLGTPNGTVDTRTGLILPPQPDHYISRYCSVAPALPETPTPIWDQFLDQATKGDQEFQSFIYDAAGYGLTGDVSEEVLSFYIGPGGNGKGTLLSVITGIMGDYHVAVPIEVFTAGSRINLEYYRAQMAGARLVTASETEQQAIWSETLIKDLTGNDTMLSGRNPFGKPFIFRSQAKVLIIGNYAPKLKSRSVAMERRLRVAPFLHQPPKPDPDLKDKLRAEYPAILRKFIDSCLRWRTFRLGYPTVVKQATERYFEQQDAFRRWTDERCEFNPTHTTRTGILLADFNAWARDNGEDSHTSNSFTQLIDHTPGLQRGREGGTGNRVTRGIALKVPPYYRPWDATDNHDAYGEQGDEA
jgi:P4 family phage/plasmid primase-like protien